MKNKTKIIDKTVEIATGVITFVFCVAAFAASVNATTSNVGAIL